MSYYLFTDIKGKLIEMRECEDAGDGPGPVAALHRRALIKKLKKPVVSWCHMGGSNQEPII
jgi:hypothetical protein